MSTLSNRKRGGNGSSDGGPPTPPPEQNGPIQTNGTTTNPTRSPVPTPTIPTPRQKFTDLFTYHSIINISLFTFLIVIGSVAINLIQAPFLVLQHKSRHYYRTWMRLTQQIWISLFIAFLSWIGKTELVLSGDLDDLKGSSKLILMANHQLYTDWVYLWCLARYKNAHGDLKIILRGDLKKFPIFGWGMQMFEFIFVARKWVTDKFVFAKNLSRAKRDPYPMWLAIFPEGTVITENTVQRCRAYKEKAGLKEDPRHVLIPKTTGLLFACRALQPNVDDIFDITMGFEGVPDGAYAHDTYPYWKVLWTKYGPKRIHMHIRRIPIQSLPGVDIDNAHRTGTQATTAALNASEDDPIERERVEKFSSWLRGYYMEKDALMDHFYKTGSFKGFVLRDQETRQEKWATGTKAIRVPVKADKMDYLALAIVAMVLLMAGKVTLMLLKWVF